MEIPKQGNRLRTSPAVSLDNFGGKHAVMQCASPTIYSTFQHSLNRKYQSKEQNAKTDKVELK